MSSLDKISMVLCVRLHDGNPWVLERLNFLLSYYDPKPVVYVLDFGSEPYFAELIQNVCNNKSAVYIYQNDQGTYSAAVARNKASYYVNSEYIFFCDVDCFGEINLFSKFNKLLSSIKSCKSNTYILPVYHFDQEVTDSLTSLFSSSKSFDERITSCFLNAIHTPYCSDESYIAPYSNVFLIHRDIFNECGGYDDRFRGHGSEDFEFLLRLGIYLNKTPLPSHVDEDCFGPLTPEFFKVTPYRGFRKLFEAMAVPAELAGLRVGHLWHPRPIDVTWHGENDSSRSRFSEVVSEYLSNFDYKDFLDKSQTHDQSYVAYRTNFYSHNEILYNVVSSMDYQQIEIIANNELQSNNYGLAASFFLKSYNANQDRVTPLILAHKCLLRSKRFKDALNCINIAKKLRPNSKKIKHKVIVTKVTVLILRFIEFLRY